jgi:hypothetical protein
MTLSKPMGALMVGPFAKYRAIAGADVAKGMLHVALDGSPKPAVTIHESDAIRRLASSA